MGCPVHWQAYIKKNIILNINKHEINVIYNKRILTFSPFSKLTCLSVSGASNLFPTKTITTSQDTF